MKNRNKKVTAMLMAVVLSNCGITGGLSTVVFAENIDNGAEAAEQNAEETSEDMYENGSGRNITSDEETDSRFSYKLVDCLEKCLIYRHIRRFAD